VVTEIARRRILRGDYGSRTPSDNRVKEASDDLGLSERQRKELSRQLKGEPMPVRSLEAVTLLRKQGLLSNVRTQKWC
jgi:hypothetical protein